MTDGQLTLFSGNANPLLAREIANYLHVSLGKALITQFSDGEIQVEILENVRGHDVFVIQPTCQPVNDSIMELMLMLDALKRASAGRLTAVMPYFGYARQDRRTRSARVPISAKVAAEIVSVAGANRALTVDLHADQIQGYFNCPVDNVYASPVLLGDIWRQKYERLMVVSPDVGGVVRARALAKELDDADLAIIDKRRPRPNEAKVMNIIGDVRGRTCILVDDIVDTAGTLGQAAEALKAQGAVKVVAYVTHAVLSGSAVENINDSVLDTMVVTNSIPLSAAAAGCPKIRQLSIAGLLAEAIRRVSNEESVSSLYVD